MSQPPQTTPSPSERLGEILREARAQKGLELADIAGTTHVRKDYLEALEEGRYGDLPEDVYSKNFLRLYAKAVGLDEARAVQLYNRETAKNAAAFEEEVDDAEDEPAPAPERPTPVRAPRSRSGPRVSGWLATLLMVVVLVGGAVWAFNTFLFNPSRVAVSSTATDPLGETFAEGGPDEPPALESDGEAGAPIQTSGAGAETSTLTTAETPANPGGAQGQVFLSITSIPEGAEVSVDNYTLPGTTPISDMPVTAGEARTLRVSLPGYLPFERSYDMSFDRNLSVALTPVQTAPTAQGDAAAGAPGNEIAEGAAIPAGEGQIALSVEEASWLEAYAGTGRGQGETLIYRTVQPGETFVFDLPVYLHVGNAGGLRYAVDGQTRGLLGSSGEVVSQAFMEE